MSKIIKVLDNNLIEIADYRCPEVIFKDGGIPPTLQDVKNEMEHLEWYCVFKETINPFELYAQNEKYKILLYKLKEYIDNDFNRFDCFGSMAVSMEMNYKREELLKMLEDIDE